MKKHALNTRRLVALSLMAALSTGLHYLEMVIPSLIPIPGFRLGLANIITLFVLYYYGGLSYLFVTAVKVVMVALISSGFGVTFFMSLTGSILAAAVSLFLYYVVKPSPYGVSVTASVFHTLGQLLCYGFVFDTYYIFTYLAILGPLSLLTGALMAFLVTFLIKRIPDSFLREEKVRRS